MAKQFLKDNLVSMLTLIVVVVGLVTTVLNTGRASGKIEQKVEHLEFSDQSMADSLKEVKGIQIDLKAKQSYLEGEVSAKLDMLIIGQGVMQTNINNVDKRVDDLMRAPTPAPTH